MDINHFINNNPDSISIISFLFSFLEGLPIVGTVLPGSLLMTPIGIVMATHPDLFWAIATAVFIGGIAGDLISFFVGKHLKSRISLKKYPKLSFMREKGEVFFKKYGVLGIFLGRFLGPLRSSIPFIAGWLNMGVKSFLIIVPPTVIAWMLTYLGPGYLVGMYQKNLFINDIYPILFILLTSIMLFWVIRHTRPSQYLLLAKWLPHSLAKQCQLTFISLLVFGTISYLVYATNFFVPINHLTLSFLRSIANPFFDHLSYWVDGFANKTIIIPTTGIFCLIGYWYGYRKEAIIIFTSMLFCAGMIALTKMSAEIARPVLSQNLNHTSSFVSGHIALMTWLTLILTSINPILKKFKIAETLIIVTIFGRLYLGFHWLSDALGGILVGLLSYQLYNLLKLYFKLNISNQTITTLAILPNLIYAAVLHGTFARLDQTINNQYFYANTPWLQSSTITTAHGQLPLIRFSPLGIKGDHLNIHGSNIESFRSMLEQNQWHIENMNQSLVTRIQNHFNDSKHLIFYPLYKGKEPILMAYKHQCRVEIWLGHDNWHGIITNNDLFTTDGCHISPLEVMSNTNKTSYWDGITYWYNAI
ncbi:MAG: VTT domain-containing protein [Candidatus Comchoanobacterales bacterium]